MILYNLINVSGLHQLKFFRCNSNIRAISLQSSKNKFERLYHSSSSKLNSFQEGIEVIIKSSGKKGIIKEKLKGGWYSCVIQEGIDIQLLKVRSSSIEIPVDKNPVIDKSVNLIRNVLENNLEEDISNYEIPYLIPPDIHSKTKRWVLFSDLHVKSSSIETCDRVLFEVNDAAAKRDAGIIFLGDFWHVRGALSVELLNRIMKSLRSWTQPVIMIPGNHDQVSLGGSIHALEPLLYAFPPEQGILISEPAICLGALWIPYRRDANLMKAILRAGNNNPDVGIIFCHADVKGAFMNDNMLCKEGIEVENFPSNIPIFSGHFHKPHTMKRGNSQLRYLGSPYQTSLSEAEQIKYLYCLQSISQNIDDSNSSKSKTKWIEEERWPINIGKKYYKVLVVLLNYFTISRLSSII